MSRMKTTTTTTTTTTNEKPPDVDAALEAGVGAAQTRKRNAFLEQLPTWSEFWRNEWKDLLPMLVCMIVAVPLNASPPIGKRKFPVPLLPDNSPDPSQLLAFSYPYRPQILAVATSAILGVGPPIIIFILAQIRLRSYPDLHASIYGLLSTLVNGTFFQVVLKSFVGGLRPYFYDACKPDLTGHTGSGWGGIMYGSEVCTADQSDLNKVLTSWPSGHSMAAMGSGLYLSIWLNAKLKVFADTRMRFWKMWCFFFPLLFGAVLCGTLTLDQSHHWYDILTGATIGMLSALASYRGRYASIFDFRFNHIPLPRSTFKVKQDPPIEEDVSTIPSRNSTVSDGKSKRRYLIKKTKTPRPKASYTKYSQRFTYDLPTLNTVEYSPYTIHPSAPTAASMQVPVTIVNNGSGTGYPAGQDSTTQSGTALPPPTTTNAAIPPTSTNVAQPPPVHAVHDWLSPARGSVPQSPYFPVLTRRWQGSAVGNGGDAFWGRSESSVLAGVPGSASGSVPKGEKESTGGAGTVKRRSSRFEIIGEDLEGELDPPHEFANTNYDASRRTSSASFRRNSTNTYGNVVNLDEIARREFGFAHSPREYGREGVKVVKTKEQRREEKEGKRAEKEGDEVHGGKGKRRDGDA